MLKERQSARSPSLLRATIRFYNRNLTFDCIVRNISPTGARLEVDAAYVLPHEFELDLPQRSTVYSCELTCGGAPARVWRGVRGIRK